MRGVLDFTCTLGVVFYNSCYELLQRARPLPYLNIVKRIDRSKPKPREIFNFFWRSFMA
jgi:hypothetical protein